MSIEFEKYRRSIRLKKSGKNFKIRAYFISILVLLILCGQTYVITPVRAYPSAPNEADITGWITWINEEWAQNPFPIPAPDNDTHLINQSWMEITYSDIRFRFEVGDNAQFNPYEGKWEHNTVWNIQSFWKADVSGVISNFDYQYECGALITGEAGYGWDHAGTAGFSQGSTSFTSPVVIENTTSYSKINVNMSFSNILINGPNNQPMLTLDLKYAFYITHNATKTSLKIDQYLTFCKVNLTELALNAGDPFLIGFDNIYQIHQDGNPITPMSENTNISRSYAVENIDLGQFSLSANFTRYDQNGTSETLAVERWIHGSGEGHTYFKTMMEVLAVNTSYFYYDPLCIVPNGIPFNEIPVGAPIGIELWCIIGAISLVILLKERLRIRKGRSFLGN